ncbi:MAG: hypothetical protein Q9172_003175 [Xanthocarpia lactea]
MEPAPVQSLKRKVGSDQGSCTKKARIAQFDPDDVQELDLGSDDGSSADSGSETTSNTLLTPSSSTASPHYPSELKTHLCTYKDCGKAFNRPAKLAQHVLSHTNTRPFVCPHESCSKDFLRRSHLSHHIKSAHSDVRDYACEWPGCEKSFITATRLKRHHGAHEGRTKFQCTVSGCGQTFRKHGTLQKHIVTVHEGRKPFSCDLRDQTGAICGQGFETAGKLRAHEGRVHGGQRFWCSICTMDTSNKDPAMPQQSQEGSTGFSTYAELQKHIKAMHPPECSTCGLVCSSQRELKSHVEVRHGEISVEDRKSFICPEPGCDRAFTKKGNLNVHIESTHKAKKYICGVVGLESLNNVEGWDGLNACGRALSTKGSLQNHIRTTHMGMGRRRSRSVKKTMEEPSDHHNGAIPNLTKLTGVGYDEVSSRHILCLMPECEFRFGRGYDLRIHLTAHHKIPKEDAEGIIGRVGDRDGPIGTERNVLPEFSMPDINARSWSAMDTQSYEDTDGVFLTEDGRFWFGDELCDNGTRGGEESFADEKEMRSLMEDGHPGVQGQDPRMIDPILR